jgi:hypothetical protein
LISSSWIFNIYTFVPSNNYWTHRWLMCSPIYMSGHYQIGKHHLGCPNNSNGCCW